MQEVVKHLHSIVLETIYNVEYIVYRRTTYMLKPYTRQQIRTDTVLASINDTHDRNIIEQILTHEDILYNIIPNTKDHTPLRDMITNTDSVVIVIDSIFKPIILDKYGGYVLDTAEYMFVNIETFSIYSDVSYIIETNYKSVHDVYIRLYTGWYKKWYKKENIV